MFLKRTLEYWQRLHNTFLCLPETSTVDCEPACLEIKILPTDLRSWYKKLSSGHTNTAIASINRNTKMIQPSLFAERKYKSHLMFYFSQMIVQNRTSLLVLRKILPQLSKVQKLHQNLPT